MLWFVAANDVAGASVVNGIRTRPMWGWIFWLVWRRGDDRRDLGMDFERWHAGHVGAPMLWFVAVYNVAGAAVVGGVRTRPVWGQFFWFVRRKENDWMDLHTDFERRRAGVLILVLRFGLVVSCGGPDESVDGWGDVGTAVVVEGIGIGVAGIVVTAGGGGVPGDAGAVEVAAVSNIGAIDVEGAGSGDNAGGVVDSAASPIIIVVIVEMQGRRGVSDVRGAGSSMVEVEGMRYSLKGRE